MTSRRIVSIIITLALLACSASVYADTNAPSVRPAYLYDVKPYYMIPVFSVADDTDPGLCKAQYNSKTPVSVHSENGDWSQISIGGGPGAPLTGYVRTSYLRFVEDADFLRSDIQTGVAMDNAKLLRDPHPDGAVEGTFAAGEALESMGIVGTNPLYLHVAVNGQVGYMLRDSVTLDETVGYDLTYPDGGEVYGIVYNGADRTGNTNLYDNPTWVAGSAVIEEIYYGTTVRVDRVEAGMYKVTIGDKQGWLHYSDVYLDSQSPEFVPVEYMGTLNPEGIIMYSFPSDKTEYLIGPANTYNTDGYHSIGVLGRAGAYWKVRDDDGVIGFVEATERYKWQYTQMTDKYLADTFACVTAPAPNQYVNVRLEPSADSEVIDRVYSGVRVLCVDGASFGENEWTRVFVNGQVGYIYTQFLNVVGRG